MNELIKKIKENFQYKALKEVLNKGLPKDNDVILHFFVLEEIMLERGLMKRKTKFKYD